MGSAPGMQRVREVPVAAVVAVADETPARAAGGMRYVHLACTPFLTHMHTGDRSADAVTMSAASSTRSLRLLDPALTTRTRAVSTGAR